MAHVSVRSRQASVFVERLGAWFAEWGWSGPAHASSESGATTDPGGEDRDWKKQNAPAR